MIQIAELFTEQQCLIHLNEYNNQITYMFRDNPSIDASTTSVVFYSYIQ